MKYHKDQYCVLILTCNTHWLVSVLARKPFVNSYLGENCYRKVPWIQAIAKTEGTNLAGIPQHSAENFADLLVVVALSQLASYLMPSLKHAVVENLFGYYCSLTSFLERLRFVAAEFAPVDYEI